MLLLLGFVHVTLLHLSLSFFIKYGSGEINNNNCYYCFIIMF